MEMTQRLRPSGSFSSAFSNSATQTYCSNGNSISTQTLDSMERDFDDDDVELWRHSYIASRSMLEFQLWSGLGWCVRGVPFSCRFPTVTASLCGGVSSDPLVLKLRCVSSRRSKSVSLILLGFRPLLIVPSVDSMECPLRPFSHRKSLSKNRLHSSSSDRELTHKEA